MSESDVDTGFVDVALRVVRTGESGDIVTIDDVERAIWTLTGWERPQALVDQVLSLVRSYGAGLLTLAGGVAWEAVAEPVQPASVPIEDVAVTESAEPFTCIECGVEKPVDEFHRDSATARGHKPRCRDCTAERRRRKRA